MVSISRWMSGSRQLEGARLAQLATRALELSGISHPPRHVAVFQAWDVGTFLLSRAPFDDALLTKLDAIASERGFHRRWPVPEDAEEETVVASVMKEGPDKYKSEGLDLSASTDDRPFFFQTLALAGKIDPEYFASLSNNEHSVGLLKTLLVLVGLLTAALFFAPFAFAGRTKKAPELWTGSAYFLAIGLGFMLVEVPWMQRFVLYLGHPSYATTVVLASLLLGAGAGSLASSSALARTARAWGILIPVLLVAANWALTPLFASTLGLSFEARVVISASILVPVGFLLGFPFPLGMATYPENHKPWFFAINGAAGVLASVVSLALSIQIGFTATTLIGASFYFIACALLLRKAQAAAFIYQGAGNMGES
jgi:hypothetical protein